MSPAAASTPMKLLLVDPNAMDLPERAKARALARVGLDVTMVSPERMRDGVRVITAAPHDEREPYRFLTGRVAGKPPNRNVFVSGLADALRAQPDVVHVLSDENFAMCLQAVTLARQLCPNALRVAHSWQNIRTTWRRHGQPLMALYLLDTGVERIVYRLVDGMVARNEHALGALRSRGFDGPVRHIPWGIDVKTVRQQAEQSLELRNLPRPWIGFAGRLVPEKAVDVLLRAAMHLDGSIILVGDGPSRDELQALVRELGIGHRVHFAGGVPRVQVPAWLRALDVLVLPSRETAGWMEQFGRVLVEAMAVGTPCVGSRTGAIPSVIGSAGTTFEMDDDRDLARAIGEALDRREALSKIAVRRADEFSWDAFAVRTRDFLDELRAAGRGRT